jgi:hypothetical protein
MKEINTTMEHNNTMVKTFSCEKCVYKCIKESEFNKHLLTKKHLADKAVGPIIPKTYSCLQCGLIYKHASSKWNHKRTCKKSSTEQIPSKEEPTNQAVLIEQMELKMHQMEQQINQLMENQKEDKNDRQKQRSYPQVGQYTANKNQNSMNSYNNVFNMISFLDQDCKDAMNISDFIDSFDEVTFDFLEQTFCSGMKSTELYTKIIIDELKTLDVQKRPIHCSDASRNTLYIKDKNIWKKYEKEDMKPISDLVNALKNKLIVTLSQNWNEDNDKFFEIIACVGTQINDDRASQKKREKGDKKEEDQINIKMIIPAIARQVSNLGNKQ